MSLPTCFTCLRGGADDVFGFSARSFDSHQFFTPFLFEGTNP
jgi:hypothetical protein